MAGCLLEVRKTRRPEDRKHRFRKTEFGSLFVGSCDQHLSQGRTANLTITASATIASGLSGLPDFRLFLTIVQILTIEKTNENHSFRGLELFFCRLLDFRTFKKKFGTFGNKPSRPYVCDIKVE